MRPPNCLFLTYFQPSLEILWRRHIRRDVKFIEPLNRRKVKTQRYRPNGSPTCRHDSKLVGDGMDKHPLPNLDVNLLERQARLAV